MNMLYFKITFFAINFVNSRYNHYICAENCVYTYYTTIISNTK